MTDPAEGVDVDGYITTGADRANLRSPFLEVVDEVVAGCRARCRDDAVLYVYGSVATGTAVEGVSDLDLLALVTSPHDRDVVGDLARETSARHREVVREVGIAVTSTKEVFADSDEGLAWRCFLKHYCVCVDGVDLAVDLPRCRPSRALARGFAAGTESVLQDVADRLPEASDEEVGVLARRAARRLLLAGAVAASIEAHTWTTSRDRAVDLLADRHPRRDDELQRAAGWADPVRVPAITRAELGTFLDGFGSWLLRRVDELTAGDEDGGGSMSTGDLRVSVVRAPGELSAKFREELAACWVDTTNAGGAVGFPFPPVSLEDVRPAVDGLAEAVAARRSILLVAGRGDRLVGWVSLDLNEFPLVAHWATVRRLQSHPDERGRGVGTALMEEVVRVARNDGLERLRLAVRGGMGLEDFYQRLGWEVVGTWPGALRFGEGDDRDEVLMALELGT